MARTPLMRALQRLAWEHRAASQLGIGVEELRERERDAGGVAAGVPQACRCCGGGRGGGGAAGVCPAGAGGGRAADRHRRRRHRRAGGGADPAGQRGLRRCVRVGGPGGRADALRLAGVRPQLLGERAAGGAVRRADRHQPQDDPAPRAQVQSGQGQPARGAAERDDATRTGSSALSTRTRRRAATSSRCTRRCRGRYRRPGTRRCTTASPRRARCSTR